MQKGGTILVNRQFRRASRGIYTTVYYIDMVSVFPGVSGKSTQQIKPLVFYQWNVFQRGGIERISVFYPVSCSMPGISLAYE